jgi:hypothetical protein
MPEYVVLVESEEGHDWWKKGMYHAQSPAEALDLAYADTYATPRRTGARTNRSRVAVAGPDCGWREFLVAVEAMPAKVTIQPASSEDGS